jgi:hypothetical protein
VINMPNWGSAFPGVFPRRGDAATEDAKRRMSWGSAFPESPLRLALLATSSRRAGLSRKAWIAWEELWRTGLLEENVKLGDEVFSPQGGDLVNR